MFMQAACTRTASTINYELNSSHDGRINEDEMKGSKTHGGRRRSVELEENLLEWPLLKLKSIPVNANGYLSRAAEAVAAPAQPVHSIISKRHKNSHNGGDWRRCMVYKV